MLSVLIGGFAIIALSLAELVALIPTYEDRLLLVIESVRALLMQLGVTIGLDALLATVPPEQVASVVRAVASSASGAGVAVVVSGLTMVFLLAGAAGLRARAEDLLGRDHPLL